MSRERDLNKIRFLSKLHPCIYDEIIKIENSTLNHTYEEFETSEFGILMFRLDVTETSEDNTTLAQIYKRERIGIERIDHLFEIEIFKKKSYTNNYFFSEKFKNTVAHEIIHAIDKMLYGKTFETCCINFNRKSNKGEYIPVEKEFCIKTVDDIFPLKIEKTRRWKRKKKTRYNEIIKEFVNEKHSKFTETKYNVYKEVKKYFKEVHKIDLESMRRLNSWIKVMKFPEAISNEEIRRLKKSIDYSKKYYQEAPHETNAFIGAALFQVDRDIDYLNHDFNTFLFMFKNYLKFYSCYDLNKINPKIKKKALNRAYNFYQAAVKKELSDIQWLYKSKTIFANDYLDVPSSLK